MIDPRVALGITKDGLRVSLTDPATVQAGVIALVGKSMNELRCKAPTTRERRRHIEHRLIPLLRRERHLVARMLQAERGATLFVHAVAGTEALGLRGMAFWLDAASGALTSNDIGIVRPHAIARLMQRTGRTDFSEVTEHVASALAVGYVVGHDYWEAGCHQVGIPICGGLFVGSVRNGIVDLGTWFKPGVNGRPSKWDDFLAFVGDLPDGDDFYPAVQQMHTRLFSGNTIASRFPFLIEPYARKEDRAGAAWDAARAQSTAGERALNA